MSRSSSQPAASRREPAVVRRLFCASSGNRIRPGHGGIHLGEPGDRAAVEHLAAAFTGARADVHQPVGAADDVHVVFHHEHGVAGGLELVQDRQQRLGVGRVQAGGGLVQHVDHAEQPGAELGGDPEPLHLAGGEGGCGPAQGQVAQAEVQQHGDPLQQVPGDGDGHLVVLAGGLLARGGSGGRQLGGGADDLGQLRHGHAR